MTHQEIHGAAAGGTLAVPAFVHRMVDPEAFDAWRRGLSERLAAANPELLIEGAPPTDSFEIGSSRIRRRGLHPIEAGYAELSRAPGMRPEIAVAVMRNGTAPIWMAFMFLRRDETWIAIPLYAEISQGITRIPLKPCLWLTDGYPQEALSLAEDIAPAVLAAVSCMAVSSRRRLSPSAASVSGREQ